MPRRTLHELDMEEAFPSQFIRESVIECSKEVCDEPDGQVNHDFQLKLTHTKSI